MVSTALAQTEWLLVKFKITVLNLGQKGACLDESGLPHQTTRRPSSVLFWQQVGWLHVVVLTSCDRRYFAYRVKKARKPAAQSKH